MVSSATAFAFAPGVTVTVTRNEPRLQGRPVRAHAVTGHHAQAGRPREYFPAHVVEATEQAVGVADSLRQRVGGEWAGTVTDHTHLRLEPSPQTRVVHAERPGRHHYHAVRQCARRTSATAAGAPAATGP